MARKYNILYIHGTEKILSIGEIPKEMGIKYIEQQQKTTRIKETALSKSKTTTHVRLQSLHMGHHYQKLAVNKEQPSNGSI